MNRPRIKPVTGPMDWLDKLYVGGLVIIFGLIVLHAPLSVYVGTIFPEHVLLIKAWKELLMGALLILAAIIVTLRGAWRSLIRGPLIIVSLALAILYAVSLQYGHGFKPYGAGLLIDLRYVLYFVLVYVAVRLFPVVRRPFLYVGVAGAVVVTVFGLLQFALPKDFLSVLGYSKSTIAPYTTIDDFEGLVRLQSTLRGPNPLGAYALIVALVAGIVALKGKLQRRHRLWFGILALGAVIVLLGSYSRSAYAGLFIGAIVGGAILLGRRRLITRKMGIGILMALVVGFVGLLAIRNTTFYTSVLRHEVAGSGPAINSDEGHDMSVRDGIAAIATHPFGYGTGSTGSASLLSNDGYIVENQYLYVAHEAGWISLGLFVALVGLILYRSYMMRADPMAVGVFASGVGLLVVGLLLPVFADDTVSIVWFGLAAVAIGGYKNGK